MGMGRAPAYIGSQSQQFGDLMFASQNGHLLIVKFYCDNGGDVNIADNYGMTAMMWAALKGHLEIVKHLWSRGSEVDIPDKYGMTALMFAS